MLFNRFFFLVNKKVFLIGTKVCNLAALTVNEKGYAIHLGTIKSCELRRKFN